MLIHRNDRAATLRARGAGRDCRQWVGDRGARREANVVGAAAVAAVAADTRSERSSTVDARHRRRRVVAEKSSG